MGKEIMLCRSSGNLHFVAHSNRETFLSIDCLKYVDQGGERVRLTLEDKERQYRAIYEAIFETPRISVTDIASLLRVTRNTASNRLNEAFSLGYLSKSQIRKRSYANMKECVYFLTCRNPAEVFPKLLQNKDIVYHAVMSGFATLWVVAKKECDFDCDVLVQGLRSDYHIPCAPDHSWDKAFEIMQKKVEDFNPQNYEPKGFIRTHWDNPVEWDLGDETLFKEFNYDLTKPITPIIKKYHISWRKVEEWLKNLPDYCTVFTCFYPKTISAYDPYLYIFETDYEDFLIGLFSELPTTSWFFKVSHRLFLYAHVKREYLRAVDSQTDIRELHFPFLVAELLRKGVIRSEAHAVVECYWNKAL